MIIYVIAMKTIIINASPRKDWNTAKLMKEAQKGAESVGAETEYVDLYDLTFTGCRSCMVCKIKDMQRCKCYWNDDLSPLINKVYEADTLLIGIPIYMGEPASQYKAFVERLIFTALSYDGGNYFEGKINVGLIYTMNASKEYYESDYKDKFADFEGLFNFLNGKIDIYASCNTLQVNDYSKYNMGLFNEEDKINSNKTQFPIDLDEAFKMGANLSK